MLWDGFATAQKQKTLVGSSSSVASDTHTAHSFNQFASWKLWRRNYQTTDSRTSMRAPLTTPKTHTLFFSTNRGPRKKGSCFPSRWALLLSLGVEDFPQVELSFSSSTSSSSSCGSFPSSWTLLLLLLLSTDEAFPQVDLSSSLSLSLSLAGCRRRLPSRLTFPLPLGV